jgi:hypothetical protein
MRSLLYFNISHREALGESRPILLIDRLSEEADLDGYPNPSLPGARI